MTPQSLLLRARTACRSAQLLLDHGDTDGACNRAYYAMFDAARAALMHQASPEQIATIRTHNGLIVTFSQLLVKTGHVDIDSGKALNRAYDLRQMADYTQQDISPEAAHAMIEQADRFITTLSNLIEPSST